MNNPILWSCFCKTRWFLKLNMQNCWDKTSIDGRLEGSFSKSPEGWETCSRVKACYFPSFSMLWLHGCTANITMAYIIHSAWCLHPGGGGGGGHSHMSVDIKCLSIDPLFYADLTPNDPPFFPQSTPNDPFFPFLYQIQHTNCKFLHTSCAFWEIYKFCGSFNIKFAKFWLGVCIKKDPISLEPTENDPLFSTWHRMLPTFLFQ